MSKQQLALDLERSLADMMNLTEALQIVCWEFTQFTTKDEDLNRIRGAVIGIANALEASAKKAEADLFRTAPAESTEAAA